SHYVTVKRIDFGNPLYATRALAKPRRVPLGLVTILKNSLFEQCHPKKINDLLCDDQISIINNPEVGLGRRTPVRRRPWRQAPRDSDCCRRSWCEPRRN